MATLADIAQYTASNVPRLSRICFFLEKDWNTTPVEGDTAQTITAHLDVDHTKVFELFFVRASEGYSEEGQITEHGKLYTTSLSIRIPKDRAEVTDVLEAIDKNKCSIVYKDRNETYKLLRQLNLQDAHKIATNNAIEISFEGSRNTRNLYVSADVWTIFEQKLPKASFTIPSSTTLSSTTIEGIEFEEIDGVLTATTDYDAADFSAGLLNRLFGDITKIILTSDNLLTLDVSALTNLNHLDCFSNSLTELDVTKNTALTRLYCYSNSLTELDITKNTEIKRLYCYSNSLTELDVSNNTKLVSFQCNNNSITSLDVSTLTAALVINCQFNNLTTIDASGLTNLQTMLCHDNSLTSVDISTASALTTFRCHNNNLSTAQLNTILSNLVSHNNTNGTLDISGNTGTHTDTTSYDTLIGRGWTITT